MGARPGLGARIDFPSSAYPVRWMWYLIMQGKIPKNSKLCFSDGGYTVTDLKPEDFAFTGATLEQYNGFKRNHNDRKKRVNILGILLTTQMRFIEKCLG
jgi:hypothetical protein